MSWDDALRALSETDFNVDDAYYAIQRYGLKELYEYLMSDFSKIVPEGKTEMEYLKDIIIEKMKEKDSEDVYNVSDDIIHSNRMVFGVPVFQGSWACIQPAL